MSCRGSLRASMWRKAWKHAVFEVGYDQINGSTILWRDRTVQIDVFADELGGHFGPRADRRPARPQPVHAAKARFIGEHDAQVSSAPGGESGGLSTASGKPFF